MSTVDLGPESVPTVRSGLSPDSPALHFYPDRTFATDSRMACCPQEDRVRDSDIPPSKSLCFGHCGLQIIVDRSHC